MDDNSLGAVADSIHAEAPATTEADAATVDTQTPAEAVETTDERQNDAPAEQTEAEKAAAASAADDDEAFELEIDGQVETLTSAQLAELVLKARDTDRVAADIEAVRAEVATEKTRLQTEAVGNLEVLGEAVVNRVNHLQSLVAALCPEKPDVDLIHTDPDAYHEMLHIWELFSGVKGKLDAELHQANQRLGQARQRRQEMSHDQLKSLVGAERAKLTAALPELQEPVKAQAFMSEARQLAISVGFTADEFDAATDHRIFKLIKLAMGGKAAPVEKAAKVAQIRKRIADKPAVARAGNGQFQGKSPGAAEAQQRVEARGGRLSDVAALIDAS